MISFTVERSTRPRLIPGKGISFPEMAQLQQRLAPHLRNMPPILIRGHSTQSDHGENFLMISPRYLGFNRETMSDSDAIKYFHVLLYSSMMALTFSQDHAGEIKNGALPLISFYRVPENFGNLEKYGNSFIYDDLRLLELPKPTLEGLSIIRVSCPVRPRKIGDIVLKDPAFFSRPSHQSGLTGEAYEQEYFAQREFILSAYHETLKMLVMLAQCNWEA